MKTSEGTEDFLPTESFLEATVPSFSPLAWSVERSWPSKNEQGALTVFLGTFFPHVFPEVMGDRHGQTTYPKGQASCHGGLGKWK